MGNKGKFTSLSVCRQDGILARMCKVSKAYQPLGHTIRENRRRIAVSQMVLAERAGVTRRFIQEVENGRSDVSLQTLIRLAAAMDMSLTEICGQIERAAGIFEKD
jgi:transcriptional regulator with XRE-family HTH domain